VATSTTSASSRIDVPSARRTTTRLSPSIDPEPWTRSMPGRSRLRRTASVMAATTSPVRRFKRSSASSGMSVMPTPYSSRRRYPVRYRAVSRSVLVGMPAVLTAAPPGAPRRSTTATRFPKYAAWVAAFSPAGPAPMTTRS
jgi:hypothetical protein